MEGFTFAVKRLYMHLKVAGLLLGPHIWVMHAMLAWLQFMELQEREQSFENQFQ